MKCTSKLVNRPPSCRNFDMLIYTRIHLMTSSVGYARSDALQALVNSLISRALGALLVMKYFINSTKSEMTVQLLCLACLMGVFVDL